MKHLKSICYAVASFVLGWVMAYIIPLLVMFGLNKAKGSGVNTEGAMFQVPAWIFLFVLVAGVVVLERIFIKNTNSYLRWFIPVLFIFGGMCSFVLWV